MSVARAPAADARPGWNASFVSPTRSVRAGNAPNTEESHDRYVGRAPSVGRMGSAQISEPRLRSRRRPASARRRFRAGSSAEHREHLPAARRPPAGLSLPLGHPGVSSHGAVRLGTRRARRCASRLSAVTLRARHIVMTVGPGRAPRSRPRSSSPLRSLVSPGSACKPSLSKPHAGRAQRLAPLSRIEIAREARYGSCSKGRFELRREGPPCHQYLCGFPVDFRIRPSFRPSSTDPNWARPNPARRSGGPTGCSPHRSTGLLRQPTG